MTLHEQTRRIMASAEQWRRHALPLAAAAAVLLLGCCALSWSSSSQETELNQLWQPHMGKLTEMVRAARPAREESLSEAAPLQRAHRGRTGHYASSWAEKMLNTGDSESPAENSDKPPRSIVTRSYSNTHPHYTSDVAESAETGDEGAYDFANKLARGSRERSSARPARQQELADMPASMMRGPETSDVREDFAQHDTRAWGFASRLHKSALAEVHTHSVPRTQSIREERTGAEQSAWDWASDYFRGRRSHHHAAPQHAAAPKPAPAPVKAAPKPAPQAVVKVVESAPKAAATAVHKQHAVLHAAAAAVQKSLRQRKIEAATRVRQDLHSSTLSFEHDKFAQRKREEQNRVREIAAREAASERAADEGAAAEFQEYGAIAAGGVPDGGSSELSEAKSEGMDMATGMQRRRQQRAQQQTTAQKLAAVAQEAKQMAHAEEEGYQKGYLAGVEAEKEQEGEDKQAWHAGAAERAIKRAQAEKKREEKEARTQDLRDDTQDDADGDFQVDGGQWGPAAGDWA